jgi:hypothetical protein
MATLARHKKEPTSKKLWAALLAAILAFVVKNSWEFVSYQIWLKNQIRMLQAKDNELEIRFVERVKSSDREADQRERRLEDIESQLRGVQLEQHRRSMGQEGRK